jgi:ribosome-associated translation inhibitor RaiA
MQLKLYGHNVGLGEAARAYVERRLTFALGRLAGRVRGVRVTLVDVNGPRGGVDKQCRAVVDLSGAGSVVVAHRADRWAGAVDGAAGRLARAVRRRLAARRRSKRRHGEEV